MNLEEFKPIYYRSVFYRDNKKKHMKLTFIKDFMNCNKETAEKILGFLESDNA